MSSLNCTSPELVVGNQELDLPKQEEASPTRTMEDLPPELLTKILEFVTLDAAEQNALLGYRLVNFQWKEIVDSLIEKKILSAEFLPSPAMSFDAVDDLKVFVPPTKFSAGRNPFPFNSLQLNQTDMEPALKDAQKRSNYLILSLPAFTSRFGGNLTSLGLRGLYRFPISSIVTMLSSMRSLKRLSLENVTNDYENIFPTPPPLPCLTILELVLTFKAWAMDEKMKNLYVWLLAFYADQLVHLHLESPVPYPALQTCYQYTFSDTCGKTRAIATTSESAFRNLKELKIIHPTRNFLLLSETPALQRFSVVYLDSYPRENFELEELTIFIDRCGSSLETLFLSYPWNPMVSWEVSNKFVDRHRPLLLPTSLNVVPRLKTLTVYFPNTDVNETVLSEFLVKFPALEKLQLLLFQFNWFDFGIEIEDLDHHQIVNNEAIEEGNNNIQLADEIVALKERLPPLLEYFSEIWINQVVAEDTLDALEIHPDDDAAVAQGRQLEAEIERLEHAEAATKMERAAIFRRLAALGVNTNKVMVEQLLERGGFWNTCPRLRIVSVSKYKKPVGVCVIQRTDEA